MTRTRALVLPCLLVSLSASSLSAPPAAVACRDPGASELMVRHINAARAARGRFPLRTSHRLTSAAARHSFRIIQRDVFSHGAIRIAGFRRVGEVIALRRGWQRTVGPSVRSWLRSPGHRTIILSRRYRYLGAACTKGWFRRRAATAWVARVGG